MNQATKKSSRILGSRASLSSLSDPHSFENLINNYLEYLSVKNYSPRTVELTKDHLRYFKEWAAERGLLRPTDITKAIIERHQRWLFYYRNSKTEKPLSFHCQHVRLSHLKNFFKWCSKNNHTLYNPASEIELPRYECRLPKSILSASEADTIINLADVTTPLGIRDRAILETFYSTGMRRQELSRLTIYNIDHTKGIMTIREGKGGKDRIIPIGDRALAWVEKYLDEVRPTLQQGPETGTLFLTMKGESFLLHSLSALVRWYVDKAELNKRGSCHMFRHTMATLMLENGADIRFIQQMLGHADLKSTQIYTRVSIKKLKDIHSMTHPAKLERSLKETSNQLAKSL